MATDKNFITFVCEQLEGLPFPIRSKNMFGEYCIWINNKPIMLVCDNTIYLKKLDSLNSYDLPCGVPYPGAKEHFIISPDDKKLLHEVVIKAEKETVSKTRRSV